MHPNRRLAGVTERLQLAMERRPIQPAGHRQHPQPLGSQGIGGLQEGGRCLALQVAEIGDRLRCPLGGDVAAAVAITPELGEHQQLTAEGVLPLQRPIGVEVLALAELLRRQPLDRQLHRIHRIAAAGQHRQLQQPVPGFLQRSTRLPELASGPGEQPLQRHAVGGEGAGLVDGEHGGAAEALHGGGPAGQHADAGQAEAPQGEEQGQHHGDLIGQQRQGQGQGRQQGLQPLAADAALNQGQGHAQTEGQQGEAPREATGVALQRRGRRGHGGEAAAQAAQLGVSGDGHRFRPAAAAGHQRAGQQAFAGGLPLHRQRFAGEQRFIQPEAYPLTQSNISRQPVALLEAQQIPQAHLIGRQLQIQAIAAQVHQRSRQAGQLGQRPAAAVLLQGIENADARHEHQQDRHLQRFADPAVDQGAGQQQQVGGLQQGHGTSDHRIPRD